MHTTTTPPPNSSWGTVADDAFGVISSAVLSMPSVQALEHLARLTSRIAGLEARIVAERTANGASDRSNEDALGRGQHTSKRETRKKTSRARATSNNPNLASDIENDELTIEQLDAIAYADDKTQGTASVDRNFIARIKASNPDIGMRIAREYVSAWESANRQESRYEKQRRLRRVYRKPTLTGLDSLIAEGDKETIDKLERAIDQRANELYQQDGGRDLPAHNHPRTDRQRRFDAFHQLMIEQGLSPAKPGAPAAPSASNRKPLLHVHLHPDNSTPSGFTGRLTDGSVLPPAVLNRYACISDWATTVYDEQGEVLHHGRTRRHASPAQHRALVARDRYCVMCGADPSRCQAHHVMPWTAPKRGETNIDELALVCVDCHQHIHDNLLTLYHQLGPPDDEGHPTRTWHTRPAHESEIPHKRKSASAETKKPGRRLACIKK